MIVVGIDAVDQIDVDLIVDLIVAFVHHFDRSLRLVVELVQWFELVQWSELVHLLELLVYLLMECSLFLGFGDFSVFPSTQSKINLVICVTTMRTKMTKRTAHQTS